MTYSKAFKISQDLLQRISELYNLDDYEVKPISAHEGGRNVVFTCEKEGHHAKIIRISFLADRSQEDILAEVEYIRFLYENGASVSNVVESINGSLSETLMYEDNRFFICVFEKAKGDQLAEKGYRYRDNVPLTEYFYNCGKVLGKMHELSKNYVPTHCRYSFFDKYNVAYIDKLIPDTLSLLKEKLYKLLGDLRQLEQSSDFYGMVHFDYSDGNYMIDYDTGEIIVFDFDNSCFCWYLFDLANLWTHGVGWIQFESDTQKRKKFMDDYFSKVIEGYCSETGIGDLMLKKLPLFIQVTLMESIIDAFEVMQNNGEELECDEEMSYIVKCIEEDIPYKGFFDEIYSCDKPFQSEERIV